MTINLSITQEKLHTISLFVANKPGVLLRVTLVFARRAFNIESLVVSSALDGKFSRMTITAQGDLETLEQIVKQLNKLEYSSYKHLKNKNIKGLMSECSICIEELNDVDEVLFTKCSHVFHKNCINKWISEYNIKCPICKIDIATGTPQI